MHRSLEGRLGAEGVRSAPGAGGQGPADAAVPAAAGLVRSGPRLLFVLVPCVAGCAGTHPDCTNVPASWAAPNTNDSSNLRALHKPPRWQGLAQAATNAPDGGTTTQRVSMPGAITPWEDLCRLRGVPNHRKSLFQLGELDASDIKSILADPNNWSKASRARKRARWQRHDFPIWSGVRSSASNNSATAHMLLCRRCPRLQAGSARRLLPASSALFPTSSERMQPRWEGRKPPIQREWPDQRQLGPDSDLSRQNQRPLPCLRRKERLAIALRSPDPLDARRGRSGVLMNAG